MTKHDERRLVEAVTRVLESNLDLNGHTRVGIRDTAQRALDAINASGIAVIMPWEATEAMAGAWPEAGCIGYAAMRDAYLAERSREDDLTEQADRN